MEGFVRELADLPAESPGASALWPRRDRTLWAALAEALGYGRDRRALRAAAVRLALGVAADEVLEAAQALPRIERLRIAGLVWLWERWQVSGPWEPLRTVICRVAPEVAVHTLRATSYVAGGAVSPGRALIAAANVVLPFAAARGEVDGDARLAARAWEVFAVLPGLPANAFTQLMMGQLGLRRLPPRALEHAGLQHLWAAHCRWKACRECPSAAPSPPSPPPPPSPPSQLPALPAELRGCYSIQQRCRDR